MQVFFVQLTDIKQSIISLVASLPPPKENIDDDGDGDGDGDDDDDDDDGGGLRDEYLLKLLPKIE